MSTLYFYFLYLIVIVIDFLRAPQNKPKQQVRKSDARLRFEFCSTLFVHDNRKHTAQCARKTKTSKILLFLWCENTLPKPQDQWYVKRGKDMHVQHGTTHPPWHENLLLLFSRIRVVFYYCLFVTSRVAVSYTSGVYFSDPDPLKLEGK